MTRAVGSIPKGGPIVLRLPLASVPVGAKLLTKAQRPRPASSGDENVSSICTGRNCPHHGETCAPGLALEVPRVPCAVTTRWAVYTCGLTHTRGWCQRRQTKAGSHRAFYPERMPSLGTWGPAAEAQGWTCGNTICRCHHPWLQDSVGISSRCPPRECRAQQAGASLHTHTHTHTPFSATTQVQHMLTDSQAHTLTLVLTLSCSHAHTHLLSHTHALPHTSDSARRVSRAEAGPGPSLFPRAWRKGALPSALGDRRRPRQTAGLSHLAREVPPGQAGLGHRQGDLRAALLPLGVPCCPGVLARERDRDGGAPRGQADFLGVRQSVLTERTPIHRSFPEADSLLTTGTERLGVRTAIFECLHWGRCCPHACPRARRTAPQPV